MGAAATKAASEGMRHCTLWKADRSPSCRSVMMALDALNLSVNEVDVNMDKGEHKTPEIIAMNPLQTLPILKDRELILTDSHCINAYLASRYCPGGRLLSNDPGARAQVEQLMLYNCGMLQPTFRRAAYPILYDSCRYVLPNNVCEVESAYTELQALLRGCKYYGGQTPSLGDISILATVSTLNVMVPIDKTRFPQLSEWLARISDEIFHLTANAKGLCEFARRVDSNRVEEEDTSAFKCPRTSMKRRLLTAGNSGAAMVPEKPSEKLTSAKEVKVEK